MSVSREWNAAARFAVCHRNCLRLWKEKDSSVDLDTICYERIEEKGMMERMLQSLSQMQCLTELYLASLNDMHRQFMESIMLKNKSTMRQASVFEVPVRNGVVYPQLTLLYCVLWQPNEAVCPQLEELSIYLEDVATLGLLSSERMKRLLLKLDSKRIVGGTSALVVELQKFQHLKELRIEALQRLPDVDADPHDWGLHPTHPLLKPFSSYTTLEILYVKSDVQIRVDMDSCVEVLVSKNPRLRYVFIYINGTTMTDASLLALSRLTDHHCLYLYPHLTADFTITGIVSAERTFTVKTAPCLH